MTLAWVLMLAFVLLLVAACGHGRRLDGPTWFDIMPFLVQSQKQRTRLQQTRRHGKRRY